MAEEGGVTVRGWREMVLVHTYVMKRKCTVRQSARESQKCNVTYPFIMKKKLKYIQNKNAL